MTCYVEKNIFPDARSQASFLFDASHEHARHEGEA